MSQTSTLEQMLVAKGISLEELGLREVGLLRGDALQAVELLRESSVPILGGDVYFIRGEGVEQAFANWHTDEHTGEGRSEFAERSCRHTTKYIEAFPHREDVTPVFVLVVSQSQE
jgi:uncharacterized protein (DUF1330 family)